MTTEQTPSIVRLDTILEIEENDLLSIPSTFAESNMFWNDSKKWVDELETPSTQVQLQSFMVTKEDVYLNHIQLIEADLSTLVVTQKQIMAFITKYHFDRSNVYKKPFLPKTASAVLYFLVKPQGEDYQIAQCSKQKTTKKLMIYLRPLTEFSSSKTGFHTQKLIVRKLH